MKKTIVIGGLLSMMVTLQVSAQGLENDDMYFNSKDREKLKTAEAEGTVNATVIPKKQKDSEFVSEPVENINPTDSYSARIINPEYIARTNSAQASAEESYFVENYGASANTYDSYSATNYNKTNATGNNYSNSYNNCGGNSMYGSGFGYSPYSSYYNPYMMNPYSYGSGTTVSLGYNSGCGCGSGSGWNYGLSYMMGNSYYNPYSYYPSSYYGYGGYPTSYGGTTEYSRNYARRPSRNSAVVIPTQRTTQQVSSSNTNSGGRVRQSPDEYYVKPARRTSSWSTTSPSGSYNRSNSDYSRTRTGGNSYSTPSRNSYSSPSRSSFSSPSRSSGGGGGGGHSRGH